MRECFLINRLEEKTGLLFDHQQASDLLKAKGLQHDLVSVHASYQRSFEDLKFAQENFTKLGLVGLVLDNLSLEDKERFLKAYLGGLIDSPFFATGKPYQKVIKLVDYVADVNSWHDLVVSYVLFPPFTASRFVYPDLVFAFLYLILRNEIDDGKDPRSVAFYFFNRSGRFKKWVDYLGYFLWLHSFNSDFSIYLYDDYTFEPIWEWYEPLLQALFPWLDEDFKESFKKVFKRVQLRLYESFSFNTPIFMFFGYKEYDQIEDWRYIAKFFKDPGCQLKLITNLNDVLPCSYEVGLKISLKRFADNLRAVFGFYHSDEEIFYGVQKLKEMVVLFDKTIRDQLKRHFKSENNITWIGIDVDGEEEISASQVAEMLEVLLERELVNYDVEPLDNKFQEEYTKIKNKKEGGVDHG